jgi:hypothetical protein
LSQACQPIQTVLDLVKRSLPLSVFAGPDVGRSPPRIRERGRSILRRAALGPSDERGPSDRRRVGWSRGTCVTCPYSARKASSSASPSSTTTRLVSWRRARGRPASPLAVRPSAVGIARRRPYGAYPRGIRRRRPRESVRGVLSARSRFDSVRPAAALRIAKPRGGHTSRGRSATRSRRRMARLNGWRRRRRVRPAPAADAEVDRLASVVVHVKGFSTATPVGA